MKKTMLAIVCGILLLGGALPGRCGEILSPQLQSLLQTADDNQELSVIVTFNGQADLGRFEPLPKSARRAGMIKALQEKANATQAHVRGFLAGRGSRDMIPLWIINGMALTAKAGVIRELAKFPEVAHVRYDETIPMLREVGATADTPTWNLDAIEARDLWAMGITGRKVVVATMDSGVDLNHPDLKANWRGGKNSWFDPYYHSKLPYDLFGHGTAAMGVMVGGHDGTPVGVAPEAKWIAAKIFTDPDSKGYVSASMSAIHHGFQWLLDPDGNPNTDDAPDVVNNSWGHAASDSCVTEFSDDIKKLRAAGIAMVFAAGNSGPDHSTSVSPANLRGVFSVGAVDESYQIVSYSSRGPSPCDESIFPRVVAPGYNVKSTIPSSNGQSSYTQVSGTSFAAPHAAGVMALLLSAFPGLTVSQLENSLVTSALDLGTQGPDNTYGNGLIDAKAAYEALVSSMVSVTLTSERDLDGWLRESTPGAGVGGGAGSGSNLLVGDDAKGRQFKSILSFDTRKIPPDAVITSATLLLIRKTIVGANPFQTLGGCFVDIASGSFNNLILEKADFKATASVRSIAKMTVPRADGTASKGGFSALGLKAINKGGITQLRLYCSLASDQDGQADQMIFWDNDGTNAQRPQLTLTYIRP